MSNEFSYNWCGHACRAVGTPEDPWLNVDDVRKAVDTERGRVFGPTTRGRVVLVGVPEEFSRLAMMHTARGEGRHFTEVRVVNLDGVAVYLRRLRGRCPERMREWLASFSASRGGIVASPAAAPVATPPTAIAKVEPQAVAPLEPIGELVWFGDRIPAYLADGVVMLDGTAVARVLGYAEARDAMRAVPDGMKGRHLVPTLGGRQQKVLVTQDGLVFLTMRSDKPGVREFQTYACAQISNLLAGRPVEPPTGKAAPVELAPASVDADPLGMMLAAAGKLYERQKALEARQDAERMQRERAEAEAKKRDDALAQRMAEVERRAMLDRAATGARAELNAAIEFYGKAAYPDDKEKCSECIRSMKHSVKADAHHVKWGDLTYEHCVKWLQHYATITGHALFRFALAGARELAVEQLELPKSAA